MCRVRLLGGGVRGRRGNGRGQRVSAAAAVVVRAGGRRGRRGRRRLRHRGPTGRRGRDGRGSGDRGVRADRTGVRRVPVFLGPRPVRRRQDGTVSDAALRQRPDAPAELGRRGRARGRPRRLDAVAGRVPVGRRPRAGRRGRRAGRLRVRLRAAAQRRPRAARLSRRHRHNRARLAGRRGQGTCRVITYTISRN